MCVLNVVCPKIRMIIKSGVSIKIVFFRKSDLLIKSGVCIKSGVS